MALAAVLQHPADVPSAFDTLPDDAFVNPVYRFIHAGVRGAGGVGAGQGMKTAAWVVAVLEAAQAAAVEAVTPVAGAAAAAQAGFQVAQMVDQLAVTPLPEDRAEQIPAVVAGVVTALREQELARRIADAKSRLQRLDATDFAAYQQATADLLALESARRALRLTET
jgi:DNA primase